MAGHAKKSRKKFEKNHLSDVLGRRNEFKKVKQRNQIKTKKKARTAEDNRRVSDDENGEAKVSERATAKAKDAANLQSMTMDDFFEQDFDMDKLKPKTKKKSKAKESKENGAKRKRDEESEGSSDEESDGGISLEGNRVRSDSESVSDNENQANGHKEDLEALAEKDPEFYNYLKENDAELLDFGGGSDLAGLDLSDTEEPPKKRRKGKLSDDEEEEEDEEDSVIEVTSAMVNKWKAALSQQNSLRAMKEVILAFRAAASANEDDSKSYKYTISSPDVYHALLIVALKNIPDVLSHHVPIKENAHGRVRVPTDSKKLRSLTPLLNSHATSLTHLLENLSDAPTLKLTQAAILPLLPYFLSFKRAIKNLLKAVINIWSDTSNTEAVRINSFLLIRRLAVISDESIRGTVLKVVYQGLIKGSRNTTSHTIQGINLMKNSAVELWGVDQSLGYATGFTYIRQLGMHLRTSTAQPTKDSYKMVYNWQYVHALDFWSRVVSTHCSPLSNPTLKQPSDSSLHPLVYPLIQVTLGAATLIPTSTYFPLRFHLIRSLLRISRATNTYIPLATPLLEVLRSNDLKNAPKPSTLRPLDFSTSIRAPKSYLHTRVYQDGTGEQVLDLLAEFFCIWTKHVVFPELIISPAVALKRWLKDSSSKSPGQGNRNTKLNTAVSLLISKLNANAEFVDKERSKIDYSVSNRTQVEKFLEEKKWEDTPLGTYVVTMRKQREQQERILEKGRRDEDARRLKDKQAEKEKEIDGAGEFEVSDEDGDEDVDMEDAGSDSE